MRFQFSEMGFFVKHCQHTFLVESSVKWPFYEHLNQRPVWIFCGGLIVYYQSTGHNFRAEDKHRLYGLWNSIVWVVPLSPLIVWVNQSCHIKCHCFLHPKFMFLSLQYLLQVAVGEGNGTPLQYSCLENPMDGGTWWAAVHGVAKSQTRLSDFTFTFHFHALEKEMATHSSVLAWRIPGAGEPGGLSSMGSHRVGHD